MSPARVGALFAIVLVVAAGFLMIMRFRAPEALPSRPAGERPTLLLLTSLPLMFGEDFSLSGGSPALTALQTRYRVLPISVSSAEELAKGRLLLMAQPMAQPPEDLVALDQWVRRGGRVMLLADPMLDWPSKRPLGDPLRPLPVFTDTGLLAHWGLSLQRAEVEGLATRQLGGERMVTSSPGSLQGRCDISTDRLVATCRIGRGEATVVADADFLDVDALGERADANLTGLLRALDDLEAK